MPTAANAKSTTPPAAEYFTLAKGKSVHLVFLSLECVSLGHRVQISDPLCGLTEPGRQGMHCQQHGDVIDFLVPAAH